MKCKAYLLMGVMFGVSACGSAVEPLNALGDPTQAKSPGLILPLATGTFSPYTGFGTASNGFGFTVIGTTAILAPLSGMVVQMDTTSLTIFYNVHLAVKISNLASTTLPVGSYATQSTQIGTATFGAQVLMTVLADGASVCPHSYLTSAARTALLLVPSTNGGPCPQ